MNKDYELVNEYLDWYECLLTDKQKEVMNMYYREDYSLGEIAENLTISRSAVSDLIKRVTLTLKGYESRLQLVEKFHYRLTQYEKIKQMNNEEINEIVDALIENE